MPIDRDAVRAPVRWKDGRTIERLRGEKVIVVIRTDAGRIYAVKI